MMEGVVQRGRAAGAGIGKDLGKPIAGKTGTTNDEKDVWFIGFSPDMVVGVFMGYDKPRHIADRATGGALAAPIVRGFMKGALADKPAGALRGPAGLKPIRGHPPTRLPAGPGGRGGLPRRVQPR